MRPFHNQPVARSDGVIPPLTNAPEFVLSLTHKAFIGAFIVKYGELLLPTIFQYYNQHESANGVVNGVVLGLVTLPVLVTFWKYSQENPTANKRTVTE